MRKTQRLFLSNKKCWGPGTKCTRLFEDETFMARVKLELECQVYEIAGQKNKIWAEGCEGHMMSAHELK